MSVEFDCEIPKRDPGWWGLRVNGAGVQEVKWCERKPMLTHFQSVRPGFGGELPSDIEKLEVVKVGINEISSPVMLSSSWQKE